MIYVISSFKLLMNSGVKISSKAVKASVVLLLFFAVKHKAIAQLCPTDANLTSQTEVDAFLVLYPNCSVLNSLTINGSGIDNLESLSNLTTIEEDLEIKNTSLVDLNGLQNITTVNEKLEIAFNLQLQSIEQLAVQGVVERLDINDNFNLRNLIGLEMILELTGSLLIRDNRRLEDISALSNLAISTITGDLFIRGNSLLSSCSIESVCAFVTILDASRIAQNGPGCGSQEEVLSQCELNCPTSDACPVDCAESTPTSVWNPVLCECSDVNVQLGCMDPEGLDFNPNNNCEETCTFASDVPICSQLTTGLCIVSLDDPDICYPFFFDNLGPIEVCLDPASLGNGTYISSIGTESICNVPQITPSQKCFTYTPFPGTSAVSFDMLACNSAGNCETTIIDLRFSVGLCEEEICTPSFIDIPCNPSNEISGCTNPQAVNYDADATCPDESCIYPLSGATLCLKEEIRTTVCFDLSILDWPSAPYIMDVSTPFNCLRLIDSNCFEYTSVAGFVGDLDFDLSICFDDADGITTCGEFEVPFSIGIPESCNEDACSIEFYDFDSCTCQERTEPIISGCTNPAEPNFNPDANCSICDCLACTDPGTCNTDCNIGDIEEWNNISCSCEFAEQSIAGCTDPEALNFDANANCLDESCVFMTGIESSYAQSLQFFLSPDGKARISNRNNVPISDYRVYSSAGKLILSNRASATITFSREMLSPGVYFFTSANGRLTFLIP